MLITVEGTTNTATLQGAVTVKATGAHITALDNTATFDSDWSNIPVDKAAFIQTINGVGPDGQGNFFLSGSECDSWGYIVGGTATDAGYKDGEGHLLPDPVVVDNGSTYSKNGIWLTDLCPACSACEMLYRLKQEVIRMKLWLAVLRDVNLYQQHSNDPEHHSGKTELTEANWLWNRRFLPDKYIQCGKYILADEEYPTSFEAYAEDEQFSKGLQLIQQYMTTVHMWNYLVNRNNKSDVISIAPEDTAGFVVQTKRAVTSCNSAQTIQCVVSITDCVVWKDNSIPEKEVWESILAGNTPEHRYTYPVSMLIPSAIVQFTPFDNDPDHPLPVDIPGTTIGIKDATVDGSKYNMILSGEPVYTEYKEGDPLPETPVYERYADTGVLPVVAAGTYEVAVKFLPFVNSQMVDEEGNPISLRGSTGDVITGTTVGDSIVFKFFDHDTAPTYLARPTTEQYLNAKTAPSVSVDFKLMWGININWTVTDSEGNENFEENTYKYICNGIRRYYSSSVIDGSTLSTAGLEPETTNA